MRDTAEESKKASISSLLKVKRLSTIGEQYLGN